MTTRLPEEIEKNIRQHIAQQAADLARMRPLIPALEHILGQPLSAEGKAEVERILLAGIDAAQQTIGHGLDAYKAALHNAMLNFTEELAKQRFGPSDVGIPDSVLEGR